MQHIFQIRDSACTTKTVENKTNADNFQMVSKQIYSSSRIKKKRKIHDCLELNVSFSIFKDFVVANRERERDNRMDS